MTGIVEFSPKGREKAHHALKVREYYIAMHPIHEVWGRGRAQIPFPCLGGSSFMLMSFNKILTLQSFYTAV